MNGQESGPFTAVAIEPTGDVYGWYLITRQYYERYRRPVMHTETDNIGIGAEEAPRWLWRQFLNARLMRDEGVPRLGFTWYSLTDQVDWDVALGDERGLVNPVGLYDLDRRPRPVAAAYREIIREFGGGRRRCSRGEIGPLTRTCYRSAARSCRNKRRDGGRRGQSSGGGGGRADTGSYHGRD